MRDEPLEVAWTDAGLNSLEEVHEYIARDNLSAADSLLAEVRTRVVQLAWQPELGFKSTVRRSQGPVRELVIFQYRILYRTELDMNRVVVLLVWHGARCNPTVKDFGH